MIVVLVGFVAALGTFLYLAITRQKIDVPTGICGTITAILVPPVMQIVKCLFPTAKSDHDKNKNTDRNKPKTGSNPPDGASDGSGQSDETPDDKGDNNEGG